MSNIFHFFEKKQTFPGPYLFIKSTDRRPIKSNAPTTRLRSIPQRQNFPKAQQLLHGDQKEIKRQFLKFNLTPARFLPIILNLLFFPIQRIFVPSVHHTFRGGRLVVEWIGVKVMVVYVRWAQMLNHNLTSGALMRLVPARCEFNLLWRRGKKQSSAEKEIEC
jgi:hypothetical protein